MRLAEIDCRRRRNVGALNQNITLSGLLLLNLKLCTHRASSTWQYSPLIGIDWMEIKSYELRAFSSIMSTVMEFVQRALRDVAGWGFVYTPFRSLLIQCWAPRRWSVLCSALSFLIAINCGAKISILSNLMDCAALGTDAEEMLTRC